MKKLFASRFGFMAVCIAIIVAVIGVNLYSTYGTMKTVPIEVTRSERINDRYLVFTNTETFENTDSWAHLKFNSSDIYARLDAGQKCNVRVNGFRIPFLSKYRNIISIVSCGA